MNSLYTYYNNVQKMAAYRQAKRMQRGVKLGYVENPSVSTSTKFTMPPVTIGLSDYSIEYFGNSIGSIGSGNAFMKTSVVAESDGILAWGYGDGSNGVNIIRFGNTSDATPNQTYPNVKFNNGDPFHLVITRQGTEIKIYVNNELAITWDTREVLDMGDMDLIFANSSDVGFVRVWNMCLSADDVTAHYNNGDPMGYVVPKLYRQFGPVTEPLADTFEFNIGSPYYQYVLAAKQYPSDCIYRVDYVVDEWNYQPQVYNTVGFLGVNGADIILGTRSWGSLETAKVGEPQSLLVRMPGAGFPALYIYGGNDNEAATARHLKVTINSITPVGLLAEYLPQNLMYGRDEKTIGTSWLDSSKQLPLSDEYMEPLFQSIGGYDMAANGAPEILYNE